MAGFETFRTGVSHVGVAEKLRDQETGIETTRSWDNYPDAEEGGIRATDILHQFAKEGEYMRFAVARYDPLKFLHHAREYASKVGFKETVWMADVVDKRGHTRAGVAPISAAITKEEFEKLHSASDAQAKDYYAEVTRRVIHGMREMMMGGIGFAYGFSNELGRGYCTKTIFEAFLRYVGIDPQKVADRWNKAVEGLAKFGSEATKGLNLNLRILAPGGFMWQSELVDPDSVKVVTYKDMTERERLMAGFAPRDISLNADLHRRLRLIQDFVKGGQSAGSEVRIGW
jgi:hypothetical protein